MYMLSSHRMILLFSRASYPLDWGGGGRYYDIIIYYRYAYYTDILNSLDIKLNLAFYTTMPIFSVTIPNDPCKKYTRKRFVIL